MQEKLKYTVEIDLLTNISEFVKEMRISVKSLREIAIERKNISATINRLEDKIDNLNRIIINNKLK